MEFLDPRITRALDRAQDVFDRQGLEPMGATDLLDVAIHNETDPEVKEALEILLEEEING